MKIIRILRGMVALQRIHAFAFFRRMFIFNEHFEFIRMNNPRGFYREKDRFPAWFPKSFTITLIPCLLPCRRGKRIAD